MHLLGDRDALAVAGRFEPVLVDDQVEYFRVGAGVTADPTMSVDLVEPQVVHVPAVRLGVAVDALALEERAAQLRGDRHDRAPAPPACPAPVRVGGRLA